MITNRIRKYFSSDDDNDRGDEWEAKCEQLAREMAHDRSEVEAGRMTIEDFDAKW